MSLRLCSVRFACALMVALALPWAVGNVAHASSEVRPWKQGQNAPALSQPDLDGQAWTLKPLRGKVVLLNFWATWCEPCRAEMPSLMTLAKRHPQQLTVLAINYQEGEPRIRRFLETAGLQLTVLLDTEGSAARAWTHRIFPTTVVLDAQGQPRFVVTGEYDWAGPEAARLIEPLLRAAAR